MGLCFKNVIPYLFVTCLDTLYHISLSSSMVRVLMVAEKPSLASSISELLSHKRMRSVKSSRNTYEWEGNFPPLNRTVQFRMVSVAGHVFSIDFHQKYQKWEGQDETALFSATTIKKETSSSIVHHLSHSARDCDYLVLWLDCDKEGENICFEVISIVEKYIRNSSRIYRARFSAITSHALHSALSSLSRPNQNMSNSVEARQEIDLKIGCAFTRFQTKFFQGKYGNLDASVISYGPCQTPTLGFCVQRHDHITHFKEERYWKLQLAVTLHNDTTSFSWNRGRVYDEPLAQLLLKMCSGTRCKVKSIDRSRERKSCPPALNTVELLRVCSRELGLSPATTMALAESLYMEGYLSYPRTESTRYPPSFNLSEVLEQQSGSPLWGSFATNLLSADKVVARGGGVDKGDHPPITPMRVASPETLQGDRWRIYEYVTRHFIASLSPHATYEVTRSQLKYGPEVFVKTWRSIGDSGWTAVLGENAGNTRVSPCALDREQELHVEKCVVVQGTTSPASYLTESDLVTLMEKNGIGTDASIPSHIQNLCDRNYCRIGPRRTMEPTPLGVTLIHGYQCIDPELALPKVRSHVEVQVERIANGTAAKEEIIAHVLSNFLEKFVFFQANVERMDALMQSKFDPVSTTGKYITRCGLCQTYMRYIHFRPQRLFCGKCNVTYALPQNGSIKEFGGAKCPLDEFGLLLFSVKEGKSYPLCPYCYNNPPFTEKGSTASNMGCNQCRHPTCAYSATTLGVAPCDTCERGTMILDPSSAPKWKFCCNLCTSLWKIEPVVYRVDLHKPGGTHTCTECGANHVQFTFHKGTEEHNLHGGALTGCLMCEDRLWSLVKTARGKACEFRRRLKSRHHAKGKGRNSGRHALSW